MCRFCWRRGRRREEPSNGTEKLSMMDTSATQTPSTADSTEPAHTNTVWKMCVWVQVQPRVWRLFRHWGVCFFSSCNSCCLLSGSGALRGPSVPDRTEARLKGKTFLDKGREFVWNFDKASKKTPSWIHDKHKWGYVFSWLCVGMETFFFFYPKWHGATSVSSWPFDLALLTAQC